MITKNDIDKMSNIEIYDLLSENLKKMYLSVQNKMSEYDFKNVVMLSIDEAKDRVKNGDDFFDLLHTITLRNVKNNYDATGLDALNDYFADISKYRTLSDDEEVIEMAKIKAGDLEAKENFICCNLKLVVYVARKYQNFGLPLLDLIQEGNIGLIKAIEKFDPNKKYKFSTYAYWWIRQSVTRAISDKGRNIRIPVHLHELFSNYRKTYKELEQKFNRKPTTAELAEILGVTEEKIDQLEVIAEDTISLNQSIGEEEDTELGDIIASNERAIDEEVISKQLAQDLRQAFIDCGLSDKEINIIKLRFGLDDGIERTLEEIGTYYGITRERVRQIESKILRKLGHNPKSRHLISYLNGGDEHPNKKNYKPNTYVDSFGKDHMISFSGNIPSPVVSYLLQCGLTNQEIKALCYLTGVPSGTPFTVTETSQIMNVSNIHITTLAMDACNKLKPYKGQEEFLNYIRKSSKNYYVKLIYKVLGLSLETEEVKKEGYGGVVTPKKISFYQYFGIFTKEEIETVLQGLTEDEMEYVRLRFGDDLEEPFTRNLSREQYDKICGVILPRIKRKLVCLREINYYFNKNYPNKIEIKKEEQKQLVLKPIK